MRNSNVCKILWVLLFFNYYTYLTVKIRSEGSLYQHIKLKHPTFNLNELIGILVFFCSYIHNYYQIDAKEKKNELIRKNGELDNIKNQEDEDSEGSNKQSESSENPTTSEECNITPRNNRLAEDTLKLNLLDNMKSQNDRAFQEKAE